MDKRGDLYAEGLDEAERIRADAPGHPQEPARDGAMKLRRRIYRTVSLRQAGAVILALTTILPLLLFLYHLNRFELLSRTETQAGLFLALLTAVLGFILFRLIVNRIAHLARTVGAQGAEPVPGIGPVTEIVQIRGAFKNLLRDLGGSREDLRELMVKLVSLNEIVELGAPILQSQNLLDRVLDRTMRAVRATIGSIMLLDPERPILRIAAARGLPDEVLDAEVKVGEEIAGKVAKLGVPVLVEDIEKDPRFAKPNDPRYGAGSFISAPIRVGDRILGVINLARKKPDSAGPPGTAPFTAIDLRFVTALTNYVAYVLDNARLRRETSRLAKRPIRPSKAALN
ncbi:MAG: GAF domain-containing protein [Candidatus Rokubacteria bacterium]|nr:GAF domain-containing protein [Candidatus Rokubacteria bacterium]